jgi:hypothetical protein
LIIGEREAMAAKAVVGGVIVSAVTVGEEISSNPTFSDFCSLGELDAFSKNDINTRLEN